MPVRIQRKRTKGWRMPENTVYVGRPSKWGNPFIVGQILSDCVYRGERGAFPYQIIQMAEVDGFICSEYLEQVLTIQDALKLYKAYILYEWEMSGDYNPWKLADKNLSCWCALDSPCHADILLELANK